MAMAADTTAVSFRKRIAKSSLPRAEQMITKWDPDAARSSYAEVNCIYLESRDEARRFLFAVDDLLKAMNSSSSSSDADADAYLVRLRHLLDVAMKRLQKEFAYVLSHHEDASLEPHSPPSSSVGGSCTFRSYLMNDDDDSMLASSPFPSASLDYLHALAECMISSGYTDECVEIYKQSRRSVVHDGMSRLGIEHLSMSHVQKINWESLDFRVMQWIAAARSVFSKIFTSERALCDAIFSESLADSCFTAISKDAAVEFFRFPYVVASKTKRPPEKILHYLSMYTLISDLSPEIDAAFSSKSTIPVQSQVEASLLKLSSVIKSMLATFESTVSKDSSRTTPPTCGLHPLTRSVMSYLMPLSSHAGVLSELYADDPLPSLVEATPAPKPPKAGKPMRLEPIEEEKPDEEVTPVSEKEGSTASSRFVWIITKLLCKLDYKAETYKDISQSYLFLSNNAQYVVNKVKESNTLEELLGQEWLTSHEKKARSFARSFLRLAWRKVLETVPDDDGSAIPELEAMRQRMLQFDRVFEETCKSQSNLVVLDEHVRNEIKSAISRNLVGRYRPFYEKCRMELRTEEGLPAVRFAPEDLLNHLSCLYCENSGSFDCWWSSWTGPPHGSGSGKGSRWRWLRESR